MSRSDGVRFGLAAVLIMPLLAGCTGTSNPLAGSEAVHDLDMSGRWVLSAADAPSCGVSFASAPGGQHGAVNPEGGCPAKFFVARRWALADGTLSITGEADESLAQFKSAGDHFTGQSSGGIPLTLTRDQDRP